MLNQGGLVDAGGIFLPHYRPNHSTASEKFKLELAGVFLFSQEFRSLKNSPHGWAEGSEHVGKLIVSGNLCADP